MTLHYCCRNIRTYEVLPAALQLSTACKCNYGIGIQKKVIIKILTIHAVITNLELTLDCVNCDGLSCGFCE